MSCAFRSEHISIAITKEWVIQHGPRTIMMSTRQPHPATSFATRSKRWTSGAVRPAAQDSHDARRSYERYLALAKAQAVAGDVIAAENYYQHAEHYFRSMSSDRGTT
jgi:hypothetical protein